MEVRQDAGALKNAAMQKQVAALLVKVGCAGGYAGGCAPVCMLLSLCPSPKVPPRSAHNCSLFIDSNLEVLFDF